MGQLVLNVVLVVVFVNLTWFFGITLYSHWAIIVGNAPIYATIPIIVSLVAIWLGIFFEFFIINNGWN